MLTKSHVLLPIFRAYACQIILSPIKHRTGGEWKGDLTFFKKKNLMKKDPEVVFKHILINFCRYASATTNFDVIG